MSKIYSKNPNDKEKVSIQFNYKDFLVWAINKVNDGHCVLISSYIQPNEDFIELCRYAGRSRLGLSPSTGSKIDKVPFVDILYCHKSQSHLFDIKI